MYRKVKPPTETPPPAWGRRKPEGGRMRTGGNTPTCVGKTHASFMIAERLKKHPHLRGEDLYRTGQHSANPETPPPAWGRLGSLTTGASDARNTPTCVGKTQKLTQNPFSMRKHPHLRGEDTLRWRVSLGRWETPPPAWGRPDLINAMHDEMGNTPTCVGKTPDELFEACCE